MLNKNKSPYICPGAFAQTLCIPVGGLIKQGELT